MTFLLDRSETCERFALLEAVDFHVALWCPQEAVVDIHALLTRYVMVVDDDIDPTNMKEVLWAMMTRVDPPTNIDIVDGAWSTPLDPRMPPDKRESKDHTNGRAIFYAVRPYAWRAWPG